MSANSPYSARSPATRCRAVPLSGLLGTTALASGVLLWSASAFANPTGGEVAGGSASITEAPGLTTIDQQSNKAILSWQRFSISPGEVTRFNQPGRDAIALNRVRGAERSDLLGRLEATGNVWLINPHGVLVGPDAKIDVGGFLATTADIPDADFFAGRYNFSIPSPVTEAAVVNQGTISLKDKGIAALVAPHVRNEGLIEGNLAQVVVAGTPTFGIDFYGDGLINFQATSQVRAADANQPLVANSGAIRTEGGRVLLTAEAAAGVVDEVIDMAGVIEARSFAMKGGEIVLDGGTSGLVAVNGTLDASGRDAGERGGVVDVLGKDIRLASAAIIDASGATGGGNVHIGGDLKGQGPRRQAKTTTIESGAKIHADAALAGNGGQVVAWADKALTFDGDITARGGRAKGNGGFVETSSPGILTILGNVDAGALFGQGGTWLIDPVDITIVPGDGGAFGTPTIGSILISNALNTGTAVVIDTSVGTGGVGDITQQAGATIVKTAGGDASLSLIADNNISIFDSIASTSGALDINLRADNDASNVGSVSFLETPVINSPVIEAAVTLNANGGDIVATANNSAGVGSGISVLGGAQLITSGDGVISMAGVGGTGAGDVGLLIRDGSGLQTENGDISLTGIGTGSAVSSNNDGISIFNGGSVVATGAGDIVMNGTGGALGTIDNQGIAIGSSAAEISSVVAANTGNIELTGSGRGTQFADAFGNYGIFLFDLGSVNLSGAGSLRLAGEGANGAPGVFVGDVFGDVQTTALTTGTGTGEIVTSGNIFIDRAITGAGSLSLDAGNNILLGRNGSIASGTIASDAGGNIEIQSTVSATGGTLNAGNNILLNTPAGVTAINISGSGDLVLLADADGSGVGAIQAFNTAEGPKLVLGGGSLALQAATGIGPTPIGGVTRLAALNTTSGALVIAQRSANPLVIGEVAGIRGLTNADLIDVSGAVTQPITVAQPVISGNSPRLAGGTIILQNNVEGRVGVNLSANAISQTGGTIITPGTLLLEELNAGGPTSFALPGNNQVVQLRVQPTADGVDSLLFVNARDLSIADNALTAGTVDIRTGGGLIVSQPMNATGSASLSSAGALLVSQPINAGSANLSVGSVILNAPIAASGAGNSIVIQTGTFDNNVGAAGLQPGTGRFLVYSIDPAADSRGVSTAQKRYDSSFTSAPPDTLPAGESFFLYQIAPVLIVTAGSGDREYGNPNPDLPVTVAGLIDGDTLQDAISGALFVVTPATQASNVGVYSTAPSPISSPLRYRLQLVDGQLSITPAPITARADDKTRGFGEPNPPFTASFDPADFRLGQDPQVLGLVVFATDATETSAPGAYTITVQGFGNANYVPDSTPGILTITGPQIKSVPPGVFNPVIPPFETTPVLVQALAQSAKSMITVAPAQQQLLPQPPRVWDEKEEYLLYSNDGNRDLWGIADVQIPAAPGR